MPDRLIRTLSLDVVAGGLAGAAFAAHVVRARMPVAFWVVLALAIWVVYTADHLFDARRVGVSASNERHAFHARHARALTVAMALAALAAAVLAFTRLPPAVLLAGLALGAMVLVHLAGVRTRFPGWLPREAAVAVIYVAGLWIGPLAVGDRYGAWVWIAFALHGAAALGYLFAYAWFEFGIDAADDSASLARTLGRARLARLLGLWTAVALLAAAAGAWSAGRRLHVAFAVLVVVNAVPFLLVRFASWFERHDRYRLAEWALLLLLLPVLIARPA